MRRRQRFRGIAAALLSLTVLLSACSSAGSKRIDVITLGSYTWNEPAILMEMVSLLIKQELPNQKIEHVKNLASNEVLHAALAKGDILIYPTWTGYEWTGPMRQPLTDQLRRDRRKIYEGVRDYAREHWQAVVPEPLGYENSYALVMRRDNAEQLGIKSVSELAARAKGMTMATDQEFSIRQGDGLADFQNWYGFSFKQAVPMDVGLMYRAVAEGQTDLAMAYSTDGRIAQLDLVALRDDRHFFPPYDAVFVINARVLAVYPQLEAPLTALSGQISTADMVAMNYRADVKGEEVTAIARSFLAQKGLLKQ